jgi:hypothetical protein
MFEHAEHCKWVSKKSPLVSDYSREVQKLTGDSSSRGFAVPPGDTMGKIAEIGEAVKLELSKANGELYGDQAAIMFQIVEFEAKLAVEYAKLEMALYIQDLLNALELEQAEMTENYKRDKAYMDRLAADVEKRKYDILIGKADIESALIDYKMREVEAQALGLDKELELIAAQILTANERLRMIQWLNEIIAKERAIISIEQDRAAILQDIIVIKKAIAVIKEGMLPLYENKSAAKTLQATAITDEVVWKKLLIELGFRKIDVKDAEASSSVTLNEKRTELEVNRLALIRASNALSKLRGEHDVSLTEYGNIIAGQVLTIEEGIKKDAIDMRLDTANIRLTNDVANEVSLINTKIGNLQEDIASTIAKIMDIANTVSRSGNTSLINSHKERTKQRAEAVWTDLNPASCMGLDNPVAEIETLIDSVNVDSVNTATSIVDDDIRIKEEQLDATVQLRHDQLANELTIAERKILTQRTVLAMQLVTNDYIISIDKYVIGVKNLLADAKDYALEIEKKADVRLVLAEVGISEAELAEVEARVELAMTDVERTTLLADIAMIYADIATRASYGSKGRRPPRPGRKQSRRFGP